MNLCTSFSPVINNSAKILILGSMPGVKSLAAAEYYAHPHNRFWPLLASLCGLPAAPLEYQAKLTMLQDGGFALWDVISFCQRTGSLDSAITNEQPNAIDKLLTAYPNIQRVAFNGLKAYTSYKKHFSVFMKTSTVEYIQLPSTSPANARWRLPELLACWQDKLLG